MKKKSIFLFMLVMAIVLSFALIGCGGSEEEDDIWTEITDISQINGRWTGTYSANQSGGGASVSLNNNIDFTFNAGKLSGTQTVTYRFTGTNAQAAYSSAKEELEDIVDSLNNNNNNSNTNAVVTSNDSNRSLTLKMNMINANIEIESINYYTDEDSYKDSHEGTMSFESIEINHNWKKIRFPNDIGGYAVLNKK